MSLVLRFCVDEVEALDDLIRTNWGMFRAAALSMKQ